MEKKVAIIDDVWETGGTMQAMRQDVSPDSLSIFLTRKDRPDQIQLTNTLYAFTSVHEWIAGCDMNIDYKDDLYYPENAFRNYPGIVIRPDKSVLKEIYQY